MRSQTTPSSFLPHEQLRFVLGLVIVASSIIVMVIARETLIADPDIWWHIKTGSWIWQHGTVPTTDPFSFTFAGHPWIAKEWLSQLIYLAAFATGSWSLVGGLGIVVIAVSVAMLYQSVSCWIKPSIAASIVLLCLLLTSSTIMARPHLLTLPLLIFWTDQLFRSSLKRERPNFLLLIVLIVWANLHAAFTMGFVIAFFAFLDFLENTRLTRRRELIGWFAFLILCPAVTLLHPYGLKAMMTTLMIVKLSDVGVLISEWQPFNAQEDKIYAVALLAMAFATLSSGFRLGMARSFLVLLLTYLFLTHMRYAFFLFPVLTLLIAPALARQFPSLSISRWRKRPLDNFEQQLNGGFKPVSLALAATMVITVGVQLFAITTAPPKQVAATEAINYLKAHRGSGNVMNYYDFGGPMIFNDIPTFVDGRSDQLFTGDFGKDAAADPRKDNNLARALDKYNIEWTIMPPNNVRAAVLDELPGWNRVFADEYAVIHQRHPPHNE